VRHCSSKSLPPQAMQRGAPPVPLVPCCSASAAPLKTQHEDESEHSIGRHASRWASA